MKTTALILIISLSGGLVNKVDTGSKNNTQVISHLEEKIDVNRNIVYAPTFRASWTMLKEDILHNNVIVGGAYQFGTALNKSPYHPANTNDWVLHSGFVQDGIIENIRNSLQTKFGISETGLDQYEDEEDAIICYSYFQKELTFKYPFEELDWTFQFGEKSTNVKCFGVSKSKDHSLTEEQKARNNQVKIYDYRDPDDFIVRLQGRKANKEIILAKVQPGKTIKETLITVLLRMQLSAPEDLIFLDELVIPKINLEIDHSYEELLGQHLSNPGWTEYFFASAKQEINFSLNESGAQGSATGEIVKIKGPQSTLYIFDKPFLVIMKEKNQTEPDLVMWIANTDYLTHAE